MFTYIILYRILTEALVINIARKTVLNEFESSSFSFKNIHFVYVIFIVFISRFYHIQNRYFSKLVRKTFSLNVKAFVCVLQIDVRSSPAGSIPRKLFLKNCIAFDNNDVLLVICTPDRLIKKKLQRFFDL